MGRNSGKEDRRRRVQGKEGRKKKRKEECEWECDTRLERSHTLPEGWAMCKLIWEGRNQKVCCLPVSLHHVDEVIGRAVTAEGDVCIVDFVLSQDALHCLQVQFTLGALSHRERRCLQTPAALSHQQPAGGEAPRSAHRSSEVDSALVLLLEADVRRLLI